MDGKEINSCLIGEAFKVAVRNSVDPAYGSEIASSAARVNGSATAWKACYQRQVDGEDARRQDRRGVDCDSLEGDTSTRPRRSPK